MSTKHTGARTSLIADPPNGRIPPLTPEGQKAVAADREFRLALLQSTDTCKNKAVQCNGGRYDPTPSSRRAELPHRVNIQGINRHDGPEDGRIFSTRSRGKGSGCRDRFPLGAVNCTDMHIPLHAERSERGLSPRHI
jgi:hypothetical protein